MRSCLIALLLLAAFASESAAATRFALFIGNNIGDSDDGALRWAEEDAQRIHSLFTKLGGVAKGRAVLLLGQDADRVQLELARLRGQIEEANRQGYRSELLIFYSGHGDAESLHLGASYLSLSSLQAQLAAVPADLRIAVIDACRTGSIKQGRSKGASRGPAFEISLVREEGPRGLVVITSAGDNEVAQESDALRGSFFTHHMISALRGAADGNADGQVSLSEFYRYAFNRTLGSSHRETAAVQHPEMSLDLEGEGELIMTVLKRASARLVLPTGVGGDFLVVDDRNGVVFAELSKPASERRVLALPKGRYRVQVRRQDKIFAAEVSLQWGGEKTLHEPMLKRQSLVAALRKGTQLDPSPWELSIGATGGMPVVLGTGLAAGSRLSLSHHSDELPFDLGGELQFTHAAAGNEAWNYRHFNLRIGLGAAYHRYVGLARFSVALTAGALVLHERAQRSEEERVDMLGGVSARSNSLAVGAYISPELRMQVPLTGAWFGSLGAGASSVWLVGQTSRTTPILFQGLLAVGKQF